MNFVTELRLNNVRKFDKRIFLYYLLSFLIISITFHNYFKYNVYTAKFYVGIFGLFLFFYYKLGITKKLIIAFIIFSTIIVIQGIMFEYSFKSHVTSFYYNIVLCFILINILPLNYNKYLVNSIYYLSIISMLFWILSNVSSSFHELIPIIAEKYHLDPLPFEEGFREQILIFTYEKERFMGIIRNAGFCHEPGAFAVILNYAIVFNYLICKKLFNKKGIIFIILMLSTFSTAGYLSLFIIMATIIFKRRKNISLSFLYSLGLIFIIWFSFTQIDFLQSKIAYHYEVESQKRLDSPTSGRIYAARKAIYILKKYPLAGRALTTISKAEETSKESTNYGFPFFASKVGLPVFILCVFLFYKTMIFFGKLYKVNKKQINVLSISFLPVLFAQSFLPSLFFNILIFYTIFKYKNYGNQHERH